MPPNALSPPKKLRECRARHGSIFGVIAAGALTGSDAGLMKRVKSFKKEAPDTFQKHFTRAVRDFKPGEKAGAPGFADDAMYLYYGGVAEHGTQTRPLALKLASMWLMYLEEKRDWEL